jgi:hypothetical protein
MDPRAAPAGSRPARRSAVRPGPLAEGEYRQAGSRRAACAGDGANLAPQTNERAPTPGHQLVDVPFSLFTIALSYIAFKEMKGKGIDCRQVAPQTAPGNTCSHRGIAGSQAMRVDGPRSRYFCGWGNGRLDCPLRVRCCLGGIRSAHAVQPLRPPRCQHATGLDGRGHWPAGTGTTTVSPRSNPDPPPTDATAQARMPLPWSWLGASDRLAPVSTGGSRLPRR